MARKKRKSQKIERSSRKILAIFKKAGWKVVGVTGSHHHLKHSDFEKLITLPHPKKDLPLGTARQIFKVVGLV